MTLDAHHRSLMRHQHHVPRPHLLVRFLDPFSGVVLWFVLSVSC